MEEYLSVIQYSHGLCLEGCQLYQLMILLVKAKSSILEPRVGVDTHCSKEKSFIIEYSTEENLLELTHKSFQHVYSKLKSPQRKLKRSLEL